MNVLIISPLGNYKECVRMYPGDSYSVVHGTVIFHRVYKYQNVRLCSRTNIMLYTKERHSNGEQVFKVSFNLYLQEEKTS